MVKPTSGVIRYFFQSGQLFDLDPVRGSLLGALNGKFWPY